MTDDGQAWIVAEISKNWIDGRSPTPPLLAQQFELVINVNAARGYRLHSFELHRVMVAADDMNETIIAVFERVRSSTVMPRRRGGGRAMTDDDRIVADLVRELDAAAPVPLMLTPASAIALAGLVQLALRHPGTLGTASLAGERFLAVLRAHFATCPTVLEVLAKGDDPHADR